ncbi:YdeI/OmpD-associated family protein [Bizionia sp. KMM 8389]
MINSDLITDYINQQVHFTKELNFLRDILNKTELTETFKWKAPVYTMNGKNVIGLAAFKNHYCLWFFNGVFLKDDQKLLVKAQDETKALRQMRLDSNTEINTKAIEAYVLEAINNEKQGIKHVKTKTSTPIVIPPILQSQLDADAKLKKAFENLTPGKQREYTKYIAAAKRETTQQNRIDKIKPLIAEGKGLHDKYKDC